MIRPSETEEFLRQVVWNADIIHSLNLIKPVGMRKDFKMSAGLPAFDLEEGQGICRKNQASMHVVATCKKQLSDKLPSESSC